eukprot:TRINITY_DN7150_c0_g1_i2.p3 TRINITY_DN7150_c0_g1~~TRINITY_DN7150_c0_g1_i2.p3  ORF type:complete len:246 (+),score=43.45 TRINITY_DN7150_c0_g1_i2:374-1111(+)
MQPCQSANKKRKMQKEKQAPQNEALNKEVQKPVKKEAIKQTKEEVKNKSAEEKLIVKKEIKLETREQTQDQKAEVKQGSQNSNPPATPTPTPTNKLTKPVKQRISPSKQKSREIPSQREQPVRLTRHAFDKDVSKMKVHQQLVVIDKLLHFSTHHCESAFNQPVTEREAPGYRSIIKSPMDLGTMRSKAVIGDYEWDDLKNDVNLVVQNCLLFNPEGNIYHDFGVQLGEEANKALQEIELQGSSQ